MAIYKCFYLVNGQSRVVGLLADAALTASNASVGRDAYDTAARIRRSRTPAHSGVSGGIAIAIQS
jgi:hypothetical protein